MKNIHEINDTLEKIVSKPSIAHIAIDAFMRKICSLRDARIAIKAGAGKIAEAFYHLLTKGV